MFRQKYSVLWLVLFSFITALVASYSLDEGGFRRVMSEWGPVELAGIVFYVVLITLLVACSCGDRLFFIHSALVLTIMTARELDFQIAFTSKNILNKNFYRHGIGNEQIGSIIAIGILAIIVLSYARYIPLWITHLKHGKPYAFSIATVVVTVPLSILIDGAPRVLHKEMGLPMSMGVKHFCMSFEEVLEMCFPLMLLWAFLQFHAEKTNSKSLTERDSPPAGPIPDR